MIRMFIHSAMAPAPANSADMSQPTNRNERLLP